MNTKLHNHKNLTAWERFANERDEKVLMMITTQDGGVAGGCELYTGLPPDIMISVLEKLLESLKRGVVPIVVNQKL